jgi:S1-C subfamily serine protease
MFKALFTAVIVVVPFALPAGRTLLAQPARATTPEIFKQYSEHVLKVEVVETGSAAKASIGTGFFADKLGRIVTNYHVISKLVHSPERYRIEITDQTGQTGAAAVLGVDVVYDLASRRIRQRKGFRARIENRRAKPGSTRWSSGISA